MSADSTEGESVSPASVNGAVTREKPPFRAEHIGSLLRPKGLLHERERFSRGEISRAELTAAEDSAISDALALQERLGLRFATDGELRRERMPLDFAIEPRALTVLCPEARGSS